MTNAEREFSLAYLTVSGCTPEEMTYIASQAGYDYVSFRFITMNVPGEINFNIIQSKQLLKNTQIAMKNTGIKLLDIELARIDEYNDPKEYEPAFEAAAELGGKHIISSIWTNNYDLYIERFAHVCDLAKQYGLTVELEFVPIASVTKLEEVVQILNTVKKDNAGILIDIHHFHRAGHHPEELAELPKEWFRFIHLCDAPAEIPDNHEEMIRIIREARSYIGEGGIDIKSIINVLPNVPLSIELPNATYVRKYGYLEHARRALTSAKKYLQEDISIYRE